MELFDSIIVGSGPSGVCAALGLIPQSTLILDVGIRSKSSELPPNHLEKVKISGQHFSSLMGEEFESIKHFDEGYLSPKLKGPLMRFILDHPDLLSSTDEFINFHAHISYAKGGLANAWGAGLMRYLDDDLSEFPLSSAELEPFYDILTKEVGISGEGDDLEDYFGSTKYIQKALRLSPLAANFLKKYQRQKHSLNKRGIFVGRPRLAVLTESLGGRPAYQYYNQDFFQPNNPSIFNPAQILDRLIEDKKIKYQANVLVTSYLEEAGKVIVNATDIKTKSQIQFSAKRLLLAAGTINSSRIVLTSNKDYDSKLPLLDNKVSFLPFVDFSLIGKGAHYDHFPGAELAVVGKENNEVLQASVYGLDGILRGDLISEFPLSIKGNISLSRILGPALGTMQVFFPDKPKAGNYVKLNEKGGLIASYQEVSSTEEGEIYRMLFKMGYFTAPFLKKRALPGSSIHYAGTMPMRKVPTKRYETDRFGRLNGSSNVYVVDGSVFPVLPAKNHSFTLMANAMRIGNYIKGNT